MARPGVDVGGPPPDEVHVWRADLGAAAPADDALLSQEERRRADRFRSPADRERYVLGRVVLRSTLARYLGADPAVLVFGETGRGKPVLTSGLGAVPGGPALEFNLAHGGQLVLLAVAAQRRVGIDVEPLGRTAPDDGLLDRICSPSERSALRDLRGADLEAAFLRLWTRKEAWIKGDGRGMALPLRDVTVGLGPPPVVDGVWHLHDLDVGPDHVGALAVEGGAVAVRYERWPP